MDKICITFAGAVGCSKTPITNYLSTKLNLPVFNNDAVRSEVIEDLGKFDAEEHLERRNKRIKDIMESGVSFICDVSVDREWKTFKKQLTINGYQFFIISIDLSKDFLTQLYKTKGYFEFLEQIDELVSDHEKFLEESKSDIGFHIKEDDFIKRCQISYEKSKQWLNNIQ